MNLRKRKTHRVSSHYWGWTASTLCLAVARKVFVLTSPFIELPAVGRIAVVARASTTRSVGRRPKTQRDEVAAPDSFDWTDSGGSAHCSDADAASFSHQAATVGLLWFGIENLPQRRIPNRGGPAETLQEILGHSRAQRQPQS